MRSVEQFQWKFSTIFETESFLTCSWRFLRSNPKSFLRHPIENDQLVLMMFQYSQQWRNQNRKQAKTSKMIQTMQINSFYVLKSNHEQTKSFETSILKFMKCCLLKLHKRCRINLKMTHTDLQLRRSLLCASLVSTGTKLDGNTRFNQCYISQVL